MCFKKTFKFCVGQIVGSCGDRCNGRIISLFILNDIIDLSCLISFLRQLRYWSGVRPSFLNVVNSCWNWRRWLLDFVLNMLWRAFHTSYDVVYAATWQRTPEESVENIQPSKSWSCWKKIQFVHRESTKVNSSSPRRFARIEIHLIQLDHWSCFNLDNLPRFISSFGSHHGKLATRQEEEEEEEMKKQSGREKKLSFRLWIPC